MAGCKQVRGITRGEANEESVRSSECKFQAKFSAGVTCTELEELTKRLDRTVNLSAFNAKQELQGIREWLGRLRGEVDTGIVRLDAFLCNLNEVGVWEQREGPN